MKLNTMVCGDCLDILPTIPDKSVDAVITDPPYPHIKRGYGYWTTEEWWKLIVEGVIPEVRRILKPTGSAVFILQPNSEKVGKIRGWLWEFMAWVCREWNMVQDVWWWNIATLPIGVCIPKERGLLRTSLKACVWAGLPDCYRKQDSVLWQPTQAALQDRAAARAGFEESPSGATVQRERMYAAFNKRGGVIPFNVLPFPNTNSTSSAGALGHGAGTPLKLADWWTRYIVPRGGLVIDPFMGSGTMALAAIQNGCHFYGCDTNPEYVEMANKRIEKVQLRFSV